MARQRLVDHWLPAMWRTRPAARLSAASPSHCCTGFALAGVCSMKMQHDILAEIGGTVREVLAAAGNHVAADDLPVEIEAA